MTTHVGILPDDILDTLLAKLSDESGGEPALGKDLQFLRLPHPRTGVPSLFLPYQRRGTKQRSIVEVQVVAPINKRSWLLSEGQVLENGKLLIMTPIDPAFLLIPVLQPLVPTDGSSGTFRPLDDIFELASEKVMATPPHEPDPKDPSTCLSKEDIATFLSLQCVHSAMKRVCEVKEVTSEITVYRYSPDKVLEYLKSKVDKLNSPVLLETSKTLVRAWAKEGLMEDGKEALLEAGQLKSACDLVCQYAPPNVRTALLASYDFAPLDSYLKTLQEEAAFLAASEMSKAEARESKTSGSTDKGGDKKRKSTAKASVGVTKLKKASTTGMSKISTFFQAKSK
ncbi:ribonuclease H2, subunit B [Irpex rosettiformis]|uniref:Ribonuclease H2, subunit B n=1 Tax=Irpex rosettiformis TaxID=378272 RepID=A0ACB8UHU5_9APHY|nr:ribonuclease H2, subunit B [Irpex rosettiformis]